MGTASANRVSTSNLSLGGAWPLVLAFAVLAIPTALRLAAAEWTRESGIHGPIILATGGWLLWREMPGFRALARPGADIVTAALMAVALPLYVFGRAYDYLTLETAGLYGVAVAMLHARLGHRVLLKIWFPIAYLAFAIPTPHIVLDALTAPLKRFVSFASTDILASAGIPVAHSGVMIVVAQYQLFVEDACAGMNSLIGLTAISLLYIYLARGSSLAYSTLLLLFVVPIAIASNIIRVLILILLTYLLGDQVAQGFAHFVAGILLFMTALCLVFALDKALFFAWTRVGRRS